MAHRKAVSVILTRDPGSTEVYLAERSPELRFFGGFYAFPGGTLDDEDLQVEVKNAETVSAHWLPYLVAAAREIFEETGLLLAHSATMPDKEKQATYRQALLEGDVTFQEILSRERLEIDAADFHHVCAILTPEFSPVRYDTQFYWVQVPAGASPDIWPGELVRGEYYTAGQALAAWRRGDMLIVPPVIFMLQELSGRSLEEAAPRIDEYAEAYRKGKIHQVYFTPGVQLVALNTRTLLPATHTNTYLVGERHLYIIDPAPSDPGEQARLWDYLDDRLAEGCRFEAILLTHHHSDHIGAVEACQKRYQLPLFAHRQTAQKLPQFHFAGFLDDGDTLDLGKTPDGRPGWKLHVYHTPGHASGHLAFREDRYGAVIAGDLVSTLSTIVISPPDGHLATYMRSLERLKSLATGTLYPGHGPALRQGREVVDYYLRHRQQREEKLLRALTQQPQRAEELVQKVYDDVEPELWPLARHSLTAGLIKLMEEGRCLQVGDAYVAV